MSSFLGHRRSPIDLEEDNCLDAKGLFTVYSKYVEIKNSRKNFYEFLFRAPAKSH
jgi:hypothetical protein